MRLRPSLYAVLSGIAWLCGACDPIPQDTAADSETDTDPIADLAFQIERTVYVTLDGTAAEGVMVMQGGTSTVQRTGGDGRVSLRLTRDVPGEIVIVASHPEARVGRVDAELETSSELTIALERYDPVDNLEYVFRDPGEPERRGTTNQCGHCHVTINDGWSESAHRGAASNPRVHDVYSGTASALDEARCEEAGGVWTAGPLPGGGAEDSQCFIGSGTLLDLDGDCDDPPCRESELNRGDCAACHAPGIDGVLEDRGLLEAAGFAYDYGVHCDVCHKVEEVHTDRNAPGVAGRLQLHRPSEPHTGIGATWRPMYFGPNHDSPNAYMGSVQRGHYQSGEICSGCHEYDQPARVPGTTLDTARWPTGRLPIHSTWTEWERGPFSPDVACNACHMPPAPWAMNSADLQMFGGAEDAGVTGGFVRPPGSVRQHTWVGPSLPESGMLQLSAATDVDTAVSNGELVVRVTTTNVGAGHRLPTGEPSRALVLRVQANCDGAPLDTIGGDVVPLFIGAVEERMAAELSRPWTRARVGDHVVALSSAGPWDYEGFGPFGDGRFTAAQKGLPHWGVQGSARVVDVDGGGNVTLDRALPEDVDRWVLSRDNAPGETPQAMGGLPGFAFARVLSDANGSLMVPHHRAVDVVSDNRLAPHQSFTTTHLFATTCEEPSVEVSLLYRRQPAWLVEERGWDVKDVLVQGVAR